MATSISHVMNYSRRAQSGTDFVGGLPTHLSYSWPLCQLCQIPMAFVGQLYASNALPLDNHLALHFYVCDDCRTQVHPNKRITLDLAETVHMQPIPRSAPLNKRQQGVKCKHQPKLYITYTPIEDSIDQATYQRRRLIEDDVPDKHLRRDKVGGLFPYDGSDSPKITATNRLLAQFLWQGIGKTLYLYQSTKIGLYPNLYW